ncbi:nucleotidyltransferase family protein [Candidatus Bipolaricaulota bacterium]
MDAASSELLPLIYWNLRDVARGDDELQALRSAYLVAWGKHAIRARRLEEAAARLASERIQTIALKGLALALQYYPDPATRVTGDIDVLIRREDVDRALQILAEQGWLPDPGRGSRLAQAMQVAHGLHLLGPDGDSLDLHWRIFLGAVEEEAYAGFWDRAVVIPHAASGALRALGPADQVLHACVHGLKWSAMPSCRWVADVVMIVGAAGPALDWSQLVQSAREHRVDFRVGHALSYAADRFGVVVPEEVRRALFGRGASWGSRLELTIVTHSPYVWGPVSAAAKAYVLYRRSGFRALHVSRAVGLARYLQERWALRSPWLVPVFGVREILRTALRGLVDRWGEGPLRRPRNRQAAASRRAPSPRHKGARNSSSRHGGKGLRRENPQSWE